MIHIKKFIDKVSLAETKQNNNLVLPMLEARGLRDEISILLVDYCDLGKVKQKETDASTIQVEIKGGSFK